MEKHTNRFHDKDAKRIKQEETFPVDWEPSFPEFDGMLVWQILKECRPSAWFNRGQNQSVDVHENCQVGCAEVWLFSFVHVFPDFLSWLLDPDYSWRASLYRLFAHVHTASAHACNPRAAHSHAVAYMCVWHQVLLWQTHRNYPDCQQRSIDGSDTSCGYPTSHLNCSVVHQTHQSIDQLWSLFSCMNQWAPDSTNLHRADANQLLSMTKLYHCCAAYRNIDPETTLWLHDQPDVVLDIDSKAIPASWVLYRPASVHGGQFHIMEPYTKHHPNWSIKIWTCLALSKSCCLNVV